MALDRVVSWWKWFAPCLLALAGCQQNPFISAPGRSWQQQPQSPEHMSQLQDLQRRTEQLSSLNQDLTAQLAQQQQQTRLAKDELSLMKKQLAETANHLKQQTLAYEQTENRLKAIQTSNARRGAATIRSNNSITSRLAVVDIPGYKVFTEGDVVRVELPADQLFQPQSPQLRQGAVATLDNVTAALARQYSGQRIGIEGHTDPSSPAGRYRSSHELTTAQALSVFNQLSMRGQLQPQQLFVMGQGANHPRYSNATQAGQTANRRIEIVVYPETVN